MYLEKKSHGNACATYCVYVVGGEGKEENRKRLQDHIKSGKLDYSMPVWKEISADGNFLTRLLFVQNDATDIMHY